MALDLLLGRTRRDFSIGSVPAGSPPPPVPLDEAIKRRVPDVRETPSELRDTGRRVVDFVKEYSPSWRDHVLSVRTKF